MGKLPKWAFGPHTDVDPAVEVRLNDDGSIDEVLTSHPVTFHMEQMDDGHFWIGLTWTEGDVEKRQCISLWRHGKHIVPQLFR